MNKFHSEIFFYAVQGLLGRKPSFRQHRWMHNPGQIYHYEFKKENDFTQNQIYEFIGNLWMWLDHYDNLSTRTSIELVEEINHYTLKINTYIKEES